MGSDSWWPSEERRDDIFAFVICLCAIVCTALLIRISIQRAVQEPTVQAAQAKEQATNASVVAAKAEHNVKQVTQQVQQNKDDVQQVRTEAKEARIVAKQVKIGNVRECTKQINLTNAAVVKLQAEVDALKQQVQTLEGSAMFKR